MIRTNYFTDNSDLQLHFNRFVDWDEIVGYYEDDFADAAEYAKSGDERFAFAPSSVPEAIEFYRQILDGYGDLCGNELSQIAQDMDREGLTFADGVVTHPRPIVDFFEKFIEAGLQPTSFQRRFGGLGIPSVVKAMAQELSYRADSAISITIGSLSVSSILEMYASEEMQNEWIPKLIAGKYSCTMGLSEPDFGSDLPNVRTRAEQKDGKWFLTGTKRFQTMACGVNEHPSVILTLARSGQGGARGLSFFLVEGKDVEIIGLEHKLGLKASATCEVAFENAPGQLIGEEGRGLSKYVIGMLNGARLSVASQGTGIGMAVLKEAGKYAAERIQFGKPIEEIPAVRRMLRTIERETMAMRCLMLEASRSVDAYHWRALRLKRKGLSERDIRGDEQVRHWDKLASAITPMSKYYSSETCNRVAYDGLQVLGGSGYIEEYDLARIYRDARITNIYDGTTQIQVNAAIGGIISGMSDQGIFRQHLQGYLNEAFATAESQELFRKFEGIVGAYKNLSGDKRDELAFEVVQTGTRLLTGLLLDRTVGKLEAGAARDARAEHVYDYAMDSMGLAAAAEYRLNSRTPAAAG